MDEAELFDGTAEYCARYRKGYPSAFLTQVVQRAALSDRSTVLDLGCGTGELAIPLAQMGCLVHAVDPSVEMLAEGLKKVSLKRGPFSVRWQVGSDQCLRALVLPQLDACMMGASFHWMDRETVLDDLHKIMPSGAVVILSGSIASIWDHQATDWQDVTRAVVQEFLGPARRAAKDVYDHPVRRHQDVLKGSPFSNVVELRVPDSGMISTEDVIGLQLSTSYASPKLLGSQLSNFVETLRARLSALNPSGSFPFRTEFEALIARSR